MTHTRPLLGVRVLEISRLLPGALACRKLADLGADVVKIEQLPGGDYLRDVPPHVDGAGLPHELADRGKRSVGVDIRTEDGSRTLHRLAEVADVVVEGARPGATSGFALDLSALRLRRPALVVCSITGFGQTGPLARLPVHGLNIDSLAGLVDVTADVATGRPLIGVNHPVAIGVELASVNAALAISAAVLGARSTGDGGWIDISCWDAAVEANRLEVLELALTSKSTLRANELGPRHAPYRTSDGEYILFCALEEKFWRRFCAEVGRLELVETWQGENGRLDYGGGEAVRSALTQIFATETAQVWRQRLAAWDLPATPVLQPDQVLLENQFIERRMIEASTFPVVASTIRWHEEDVRAGEGRPGAPAVGEHTDEVLSEWLGPYERETSAPL